jgi:hypothetical protein
VRWLLVALALAALAGGVLLATGAFDSDKAEGVDGSCDPATPFQRTRPLSEGFAYRRPTTGHVDRVVKHVKTGTERSDYGRDDLEGRVLLREGREIAAVWSMRPPPGVDPDELAAGLTFAAQRSIPKAQARTVEVHLDVHPATVVHLETKRGTGLYVVARLGCRVFLAQGSEGVATMNAVEGLLLAAD